MLNMHEQNQARVSAFFYSVGRGKETWHNPRIVVRALVQDVGDLGFSPILPKAFKYLSLKRMFQL